MGSVGNGLEKNKMMNKGRRRIAVVDEGTDVR
jgi:hypothetical protein